MDSNTPKQQGEIPQQSELPARQHDRLDRRTFIRGGLAASGVLAGVGLGIDRLADASEDGGGSAPPSKPRIPPTTTPKQPNILVIVVDQLRYPAWFSPMANGTALPPNLRRLREGAVSFAGHYTAANDCTPARSTLLTGLYTHQTGCMITGGSTLDPGFPTWGTMLREHGYHTRWYGKWHLTHRDGKWGPVRGTRALARYGFGGGTFPSPNGAPGQGWRLDGRIERQFARWFKHERPAEPWCTTVSFVNPHDIAWWYVWSNRVAPEATAQSVTEGLPANFETPELLIERGKPQLQRSLQETAAASFGPVPFEGPEVVALWTEFLNLYAKLQREVDKHIGSVLDTLERHPSVAANTIVVFTSDHGEYGGSHGLRGKGAGAYEEAIHVPLLVKDYRGEFAQAPETVRTQLTSSVDVAPLLLTLATGSNDWREQPHYAHISERADLAAMLKDPNAPGRPYVLHTTDETVTEYAIEAYAASAPLHVIAVRTSEGKYAAYSDWVPDGIELAGNGQEDELYDYSTDSGRMELRNSAGQGPLQASLNQTFEQALTHELRQPLPANLNAAHARGFTDYFTTAKAAAANATEIRERRARKVFEGFSESGGAATGETGFRGPQRERFRSASRARRR